MRPESEYSCHIEASAARKPAMLNRTVCLGANGKERFTESGGVHSGRWWSGFINKSTIACLRSGWQSLISIALRKADNTPYLGWFAFHLSRHHEQIDKCHSSAEWVARGVSSDKRRGVP